MVSFISIVFVVAKLNFLKALRIDSVSTKWSFLRRFWALTPPKYGSNITEILYQRYNHGHNILRLFDSLPNFLFTSSEIIVIISNKHGIHELPRELSNDL